MRKRVRDDKLRAEIGIYEGLMDDVAALADIFIGNETIEDFNRAGEYVPFLRLVAEFHFDPGNERLHKELSRRINLIKKNLLDLSIQIDTNHRKAKFIYGD